MRHILTSWATDYMAKLEPMASTVEYCKVDTVFGGVVEDIVQEGVCIQV